MSQTPKTDEPIATGDRRDMHLEPDPDQLVVAKSGQAPRSALPPEEQSAAVDHGELSDRPPIGEVNVTPDGPSVWDARPPAADADADADKNGEPA